MVAKDPSGVLNRTLLITGVTGTLGKALLAHLAWNGPIRGLSRDEQKQQELRNCGLPGLRLILGDIRDPEKLRMAFRGVGAVIHCAALKIVPNAAYNPDEIVLTNALGTINVCREAIHAGVERVLVVSSDKAVEPTTLYGAAKMCGEHIAIQANNWSDTRISAIRFGNIIDSRGSITTMFGHWSERGEPIPLTSEAMTRFWVTQKQAVTFIEMALDRMQGGETFVPKITAKRLLDLLPRGARWRIIGRRQTERDFEILVGDRELEHTDEFSTHFEVHSWPYQGNTQRTAAYRSDTSCGLDPSAGQQQPPPEEV